MKRLERVSGLEECATLHRLQSSSPSASSYITVILLCPQTGSPTALPEAGLASTTGQQQLTQAWGACP